MRRGREAIPCPLEKYQMPSSDVTAVEPPVWEVKQGVVGTQAELSEA